MCDLSLYWGLLVALAYLPAMSAAEEQTNAPLKRDTAILSSEDRARLLRRSFECKAEEGARGQAHCTEQQDAARRELVERTRRNHDLAKRRMLEKY